MKLCEGFGKGAEPIALQGNSHVRCRSARWVAFEEGLTGEVFLGIVEAPGELQDRPTIFDARHSRHVPEAPPTTLHQHLVSEGELPCVDAAGPST